MLRASPAHACCLALLLIVSASAGDYPRILYAYPGRTPTLDGVLAPGEWDDALQFTGVNRWVSQPDSVKDPRDLSVRVYVKHDDQKLYFAFDVTDDVLYGIDTPRWLPDENPKANELTPQGWPWFGDSIELMLNPSNHWKENETVAGDWSSWDMICNLARSSKDAAAGGLLEGEPRSNANAWTMYQRWIASKAQEAVVKPKPGGHGYIVEWAIRFDPCLEVARGKFYSIAMGDRAMGLNLALRDLDEKEKGNGRFANVHHQEWLAGGGAPALLRNWATLWLMARPTQSPHPIKILRD